MFDIQRGHLADFVQRNRDPQAVWFFHHIPKTAGSSLSAEIIRSVGQDGYLNLVPDYGGAGVHYRSSLDTLTEGAVARATGETFVRMISGHLQACHVDYLVNSIPNLRLFSFVRHPVARVISEYNYCCSTLHPLSSEFRARFPSIDQYLAAPGEMNKMALMMLGSDQMDPDDAIRAMKARYTMIGVQERYPLSFLLLSALMLEPALPRVRERVGANVAKPDSDLVERILHVNSLDLALYESVNEIYESIAPEILDVLSPVVAK